jgi:hypothetical protein
VATRDVERLLEERGLADAPTAARLARLAGGRPGVAVAYAATPGAETIRAELVRTLLDLLDRPRADRLGAARDLLGRAMTLARALDPVTTAIANDAPRRRGRGRTAADELEAPSTGAAADTTEEPAAGDAGAKVSAAERRRALALLLDLWREVARDLACAQRGAAASIRDVALLEEVEAAARRLRPGAAGEALARLVRAGELLEVNATPELVLDVLLIRWPHAEEAA